jgi:hypothetical protein
MAMKDSWRGRACRELRGAGESTGSFFHAGFETLFRVSPLAGNRFTNRLHTSSRGTTCPPSKVRIQPHNPYLARRPRILAKCSGETTLSFWPWSSLILKSGLIPSTLNHFQKFRVSFLQNASPWPIPINSPYGPLIPTKASAETEITFGQTFYLTRGAAGSLKVCPLFRQVISGKRHLGPDPGT